MTISQRPRWQALAVLWLAGGAVLGLSLLARTVHAHANLAHAVPAPYAMLQQSPERVTLWFTEPIAPGLSSIQVLNVHGQRVESAVSTVDQTDLTVMSIALQPLPEGIFTVAWRNVSHVDGHRVQGSFVFSVGAPPGGMPQVTVQEPSWFQTPAEPVLRWLVLLSAVVLVGGLGFALLVARLRRAEGQSSDALQDVQQQMTSRTWQRMWLALGVLLTVSLGQLGVQATGTATQPPQTGFGSLLVAVLTGTYWGHLWLWRIGILLALAVVLSRSAGMRPRDDAGETPAARSRWGMQVLALSIGGGLLFTLSLVSHGAATAHIRAAAICADALHLAAAACWLGGLCHLASDLPLILRTLSRLERRAMLAVLVPRFSILATLCVGTLLITGLYSAWVQVTVLPALRTPYGLTLLAKLALSIPLLILGALNLLWVRPRLAHEDSAGRWLARLVTGEAVLGTLVLGAVGCLTSLEPARQAMTRQGMLSRPGLTFHDMVEGTHITLTLLPGLVGPNRLSISLTDHGGAPIRHTSEVTIRLRYEDADLGEPSLSALAAGDGTYVLNNVFLSIAGRWQVQLLVRRPDAFDARTVFHFTVMSGERDSSPAIVPGRHTGMLLWGGALVLLGGLCLVTEIPLRGWQTPVGTLVLGCGVLLILVGLLLIQRQLVRSGVPAAQSITDVSRAGSA